MSYREILVKIKTKEGEYSRTVIDLSSNDKFITTRKRKTHSTDHETVDLTTQVKIQRVTDEDQGSPTQEKDKKIQEDANSPLEITKTVQDAPCGALKSVCVLGEGAYGKVYKVKDEKGRFFAKKVVMGEDGDFDYPSSMRELSVTKTFQGHPNIVRCFDAFVNLDRREYSIVLELMDGNLKNLWETENSTFRMTHFQSIAYQILSGLSFMHSENIAHRDIKSQNIFYRKVDNRLEVKLGDFGLSRRFSVKNYTGEVITYSYRPPEMLLFSRLVQYGTEIDVWSAGMVFTEIILGYNLTYWCGEKKLVQRLATIFDLSSYKSPLTTNITPEGLTNYLKTSSQNSLDPFLLDPLLLDLLEKMMNVEPTKRVSAQDALNHPYFSSFTPLNHNIFVPQPTFLEPNTFDWTLKHPDLKKEMRVTLVDWLKDVAKEYYNNTETFSQCIEILDIFMTKTTDQIKRDKFQLVGAAAILISSAMNDVCTLDTNTLVAICDNAYNHRQLLEMTWRIFRCIGYLMPRTRLEPKVYKRSSPSDLIDVCAKYCSSFPCVQL